MKRPWFKLYSQDFLLGVQDLSAEQIGVYTVLLVRMYAHGGSVTRNDKRLAAACGHLQLRRFRRVLAELVAEGKLLIFGDQITNARVQAQIETEAKEAANLSESGAKGGSTRRANLQSHSNENNDLPQDWLGENPSSQSQSQSHIVKVASNEATKSPRASRLPKDWQPDADGMTFARGLGLDVDAVLAEFTDHWTAVAGSSGCKLDWPATWRNWCRRQARMTGKVPRPEPQSSLPLMAVVEGGKGNIASDVQALIAKLPDTRLETIGGEKVPCLNGIGVAGFAQEVAEAANLPDNWRGDWAPLANWLRTYDAYAIVLPAIRSVAGRSNYQIPRSLRFFDMAILDFANGRLSGYRRSVG